MVQDATFATACFGFIIEGLWYSVLCYHHRPRQLPRLRRRSQSEHSTVSWRFRLFLTASISTSLRLESCTAKKKKLILRGHSYHPVSLYSIAGHVFGQKSVCQAALSVELRVAVRDAYILWGIITASDRSMSARPWHNSLRLCPCGLSPIRHES